MTAPVDVLYVSGEPLWPPHHGGRIRGGRIVEELRGRMDVLVAAPVEGQPPDRVRLEHLPEEEPAGRVAGVVLPGPRLGRELLGPRRRAVLLDAVARRRPGVVLFASGYLAAAAPAFGAPVGVDFVDVEARRMASFARAPGASLRSRTAAGWEYVKARRWEPAVARRCAVAAVPSEADVDLLRSWGAPAVHVPNGADHHPVTPSPPDGPVTFVASFDYRANAEAARFLLDEIWPLVRRAEPAVRLRLAGRAAHCVAGGGVAMVADPDDVDPVYREASVILAPVRAGGGSQLKVTEALAHGRAVVATSFSARSAPAAAAGAVLVADDPATLAAHVVHLWRDVAARRVAEKALADPPPIPTWEEACAPLVDALEQVVRGRRT